MDEQTRQLKRRITSACCDISANLGNINIYVGPQALWDGLGTVFIRKYNELMVRIEIIELHGGGQINFRARAEDSEVVSAYLIIYSYREADTPVLETADNQRISLEEVAEILNSLLEVIPPPPTTLPKQVD